MDHVPLPDRFVPHTVTVRDYLGDGGLGPVHSETRTIDRAFAEDDRKLVIDTAGQEVVSNSQVVVDFDQQIPVGSLMTIWPGTPGEREALVITTSRHHHPTIPSYQTVYLA